MILKSWDQDKRKKKSRRIITTDEGMEKRETNASINLTKGHTMLMINAESLHIWNSFFRFTHYRCIHHLCEVSPPSPPD